MKTEIEVLTNNHEIEIRGEKIIVTPYSWMNTIKMAKPLAVVLKAISDNIEKLQGMSNAINGENQLVSLVVILDTINSVNESDKLINAIRELICTGIKKDMEYLDDLDVEEIFEVGKAVFEVNRDFFTKIMNKLPKTETVTEEK